MDRVLTRMLQLRISPAGAHYVAAIVGRDTIQIFDAEDDALIEVRTVPNYGTSFGELIGRKTCAFGAAQFPGGEWVIYYYDTADQNFGYALNVADQGMSEWGYAPFPVAGAEDPDDLF